MKPIEIEYTTNYTDGRLSDETWWVKHSDQHRTTYLSREEIEAIQVYKLPPKVEKI